MADEIEHRDVSRDGQEDGDDEVSYTNTEDSNHPARL